MHDENYKTLFAFPRMVEDLLRAVVKDEWLEQADFTTLRKLSSEYVGEGLRRRHGDTVWRVRVGRGWLHVLVVLEFQSSDDPDMALRVLEYTALLYRELRRNGALGRDGLRPPVLPVVLYNGQARWTAALEVRELVAGVEASLAPYQPSQRYLVLDERNVEEDALPARNLMAAVVGLEQSRSLADLLRVVRALGEWLRDPHDRELIRAFAQWVRSLESRLARDGEEELSPAETLEEVRMTLEERVSQWPKEWIEHGRELGFRQGIEQGIERGLERGIEQGLEQGIEHERALLCRLAAVRFGADAAEALSAALAGIEDPERLADVGAWLVSCDTGEEFFARAFSSPPDGAPSGV